jgi:transposase InsO family protein
MDRARYAVDAVLVEGQSLRSVASSIGMSKSWVAKQVVRFNSGGYEALVPLTTAPHRRPTQTSVELENEIVTMRKHLDEEGLTWTRFEASLPNETWQADMTHWVIDDGTEEGMKVEILDFVDDYSRMVVAAVVVPVATAADVVAAFYQATSTWGFPASMLTDNGGIFTAQFRNGRCGFETELTTLGIGIKHGKPYHPQTQGKIERFHKTLKRWLRKRDLATSIAELQGQIDFFVRYYNEERPHSARGMVPPRTAYDALEKDTPDPDKYPMTPHTRVRHDKVDTTGVFTLRHGTKLHHVGVGRAHTGRRIIILVCDLDIRVLSEEGELLRHLTLDPTRDYQRLGTSP